MAIATISSVAVKVSTDLGDAPDAGPAVSTLSAAQPAGFDVYHRINPYFYRVYEKTENVLVEFECEHMPANSVEYANGNGLPQSHTWAGSIEVDTTRTARTVEAARQRQITVMSAPSTKVERTIVCTFEVVATRNLRTQQWDLLPPPTEPPPHCHLKFDLTP